MRLLFRLAAALAGMALLGGCQSLSGPVKPGESTQIPVGSVLVLHKRLVVTSSHDRIRFYRGAIAEDKDFLLTKKYEPNCRLVMHRDLSEYNHVITPGRFDVYAVKQFDDYEILGPRIVASNGPLLADDGGILPQEFATVLYLRSTEQPQVDRLVCGHYQYSTDGRFLTINQIRAALGDIFTLQLAH
ncbi:MAG TPA: hypothetical protein VKA50_08200 [Gammaproteobacteria bacterium]|nr:hypothetical protein [Gammaproteobacteria bacterium]